MPSAQRSNSTIDTPTSILASTSWTVWVRFRTRPSPYGARGHFQTGHRGRIELLAHLQRANPIFVPRNITSLWVHNKVCFWRFFWNRQSEIFWNFCCCKGHVPETTTNSLSMVTSQRPQQKELGTRSPVLLHVKWPEQLSGGAMHSLSQSGPYKFASQSSHRSPATEKWHSYESKSSGKGCTGLLNKVTHLVWSSIEDGQLLCEVLSHLWMGTDSNIGLCSRFLHSNTLLTVGTGGKWNQHNWWIRLQKKNRLCDLWRVPFLFRKKSKDWKTTKYIHSDMFDYSFLEGEKERLKKNSNLDRWQITHWNSQVDTVWHR